MVPRPSTRGVVRFKGYWAAEARVRFPRLAGGHLQAEAYGRSHDYPQEDYFGLGPDTPRSAQADFKLRAETFGARAAVRVVPVAAVGAGVEYYDPRVSDGTDESIYSISAQFDEASAPGLSAQPDYVRTIAFVDVDWRRPLNARNGGWYRVELNHYSDRDLDLYSFTRLDVDLRQFVSFLSERSVLVGRVAASTSETDSGQTMPFYLMWTLGGNDTLRGFRDYRFRGPHGVLLQAEYRFEIWSGLDAALFYDAGKWRCAGLTSTSKTSSPTMASASVSTPIRASSYAWTPLLGAAMGSIFGSSSVAGSRLALVAVVAILSTIGVSSNDGPRFYSDDPAWSDDDAAFDASAAVATEDANSYDFVVNTFGKPGERRDVRAMNINTIDEVPDSAWFVNRIGRKAMSTAEAVRGPDRYESISLDGWTVSPARAPGCNQDSA
jgi:hypothetical protein